MKNFPRFFVALLLVSVPASSSSFVNWESPHVHPMDLTPSGEILLLVNTADNRLEVFTTLDGGLQPVGAVPVGLDPVTVRARSESEAWVVNHVSDSISVVDLPTLRVRATLYPGDEPTDVVFAGNPKRAFVSVSQENALKVFDPSDLSAEPVLIPIAGEDPRALATDGGRVYAAIFESGNKTTVLDEFTASFPPNNPYPGDPNPVPNDGEDFNPPIADGLPDPPAQSLIVKKDESGAWLDVNGFDWSNAVDWDLHDHDVAIVSAGDLSVTYATGTMNLNMALGVRPGRGVTVVGTEAINEVRFEPNLRGIFGRVMGAHVTRTGQVRQLRDLNPQLDYSVGQVPQPIRDRALGDPRAVIWNAAGSEAFVAGMGSNNVVVFDAQLRRTARIEVGEGPTGLGLHPNGERLYVLNKFEASVSVIDVASRQEALRVSFFDPTPEAIRLGRPFLYDTHRTSGLGHVSCATCHIDGRMDQVSWDLGSPQGEVKEFNQICQDDFGTDCEDWHPMKGPMATQTLVGIVGVSEPFHWRGDREDLSAFNETFENLQGDDRQLTSEEMARFTDFVATLTPPPNPFRGVDNSLPTDFSNGGNAEIGLNLFNTARLDNPFNCVDCHQPLSGSSNEITSNELDLQTQSVNQPHLLNLYEKTGFDTSKSDNNRGFGFVKDGSFDTLFNFLGFGFNFDNDQQKLDVEAYILSFSEVTHAGVGVQVTVPDSGAPGARASLETLIDLASAGEFGLVARGRVGGETRGYYLVDETTLQSDRAAESVRLDDLLALATEGSEVTFTAVPLGSEVRIGVDRDEDGVFDGDE